MTTKPVHIFGEGFDVKTLEQFYSAVDLPWVVKAALMPDAHVGYSMPIGGVAATDGMIVPAWVGYDIGCGMCAAKTGLTLNDILPHRELIFQSIYRAVPTGFRRNKHPEEWDYSHLPMSDFLKYLFEKERGLTQLGSLGSGNHFIEIDFDENQVIWIVVHSGSRHVGHQVATNYMKKAAHSDKAKEGHYPLKVSETPGKNYITDLNFCLAFALENRKKIIDRVNRELYYYGAKRTEPKILKFINRNHNHAEEKDGLWIHRKGATHAEAGMEGVIPGNMRDGSFVVIGKGNPDALWSSSHGAGRRLSRTKAKKELSMNDFTKAMEGVTSKVERGTLDEAPGAYKDIFEVLKFQDGLIDVTHHLRPVINIKA